MNELLQQQMDWIRVKLARHSGLSVGRTSVLAAAAATAPSK